MHMQCAVKCHTVTDLSPPSTKYVETLKQLLCLSLKPDTHIHTLTHTKRHTHKLPNQYADAQQRQLILTTVNTDTVWSHKGSLDTKPGGTAVEAQFVYLYVRK